MKLRQDIAAVFSMSNDMNWLTKSIRCNGEIVSMPIDVEGPLFELSEQIRFRTILLFNAWEIYACDGRMMSLEDFEQMEQIELALADPGLTEERLRLLVCEIGEFIGDHWAQVDEISDLALARTRQSIERDG